MAHRWLRTTRLILITLLATGLISCGGSGGGTGSGGFLGGNPNGDPDNWTITLTLTDDSGSAVNTLVSGDTATLTATLTKEGTEEVVAGEVVSLTGTGVDISPGGAVTTDAGGVAQFTITAGLEGGAASLTASAEAPGGATSATLNINIDAVSPTLQLSLTDETGTPITQVDPLTAGYIAVVLTDGDDQPIEGGIISLTSTVGAVLPESGTALTDGNGLATFRVTTGQLAGAGTLTASYSSGDNTFSTSINFEVITTLPFTLIPSFRDGEGLEIVSAGTSQTIELAVQVLDNRSGDPVILQLVSADIGGLGTIVPESGNALTDENGLASFAVTVGNSIGAFNVEVSAIVAGGAVSETLALNVVQATRKLGYFENGVFTEGTIKIEPAEQLSPTGTAALTIAVVDENDERTDTQETITLTSDCLYSSLAQIEPTSAITFTSQITISYTAAGCSGGDELTATLASTGAKAVGTVDIAPLEAESISFIEASPALIGLRETGNASGLPEKSTIRFQVADLDGNPIPDVRVNFSLSTYVGGAALNCEGESICEYDSDDDAALDRSKTSTDQSDLNGVAEVELLSGYVATPVRVSAYIDLNNNNERDPTEPQTTTKQLVITTGLPDQDSISLSASVLNVLGAFDTDGVESDITVRMADKYNNPVPDNTQAVFTTELGSIVGSCLTTEGACTVSWTSQDPRLPAYADPVTIHRTRWFSGDSWNYDCPSHRESSGPCPDDIADPAINSPGFARGGRSTILVSTIGEESFVDSNGNGLYDEGEFWTNLPEAFRDDNEDGVHTPSQRENCDDPVDGDDLCKAGFDEDYIDFNTNGVYDLNDTPKAAQGSSLPDGLYNGVLCSDSSAASAVCSRDLLNVRDSLVLVMSFSNASDYQLMAVRQKAFAQDEPSKLDGDESYIIYIADHFNNPPPAGSTISYEGSGRCDVLTPAPTIGDTNRAGAFGVAFAVSTADGEDPSADPDQVSILLTLPNGSTTVKTYACEVDDPIQEGDGDGDGLGLGPG